MATEMDCDHLLVKRAQGGDRHAFGLLVVKYQRRITKLVSRFTRTQSEAEDIAQDAFIKAFRALPRFRGDSQFYTWLYRIAVNLAKTHWQGYGRYNVAFDAIDPISSSQMFEGDGPSHEDSPEAILIGKQTADALARALETLPFDFRAALIMREVDGLSYDEIAGVLMCPVGTIRSRIFRAREIISSYLSDRA